MLESVVVWQHAWWDSGAYGAWWQTRARVPSAATKRCNRELLHSQARCNVQTQEANAKENVLQMPVRHVKQSNCRTGAPWGIRSLHTSTMLGRKFGKLLKRWDEKFLC